MKTWIVRCGWIVCVLLSCTVSRAAAQDRERDRDRQQEQEYDDQSRMDRSGDALGDEAPRINPRLVPPPPDRPDREGRWYLGVEVDYRDYGAVITRVVRQSPAQRAGLEARDVIVTVRGYQVGYVNNRLYPLNRELELRADRRGNVTLLVQNQRNGSLTNIPVRLQPADRPDEPPRVAPLIGTVTSRRMDRLPRGAVLTIRLMDITDPRTALVPIAQRRYDDLGPLPIPFELSYDPDRIVPNHRYALQAAVTVNGLAAFRTRETYEVFGDGPPRRVDMVLESVR